MHTLLLYLLILLNLIQSLTQTQAKTFNNGFTFDLIHRYSLKSPFYNSSMSLVERYHSLALHSYSRHRHINHLEVNNLETDLSLIPNNGDYLLKIAVGVPPVDLFVILDTTNDLIWVQCKPCYNCNMKNNQIYDPTQSISYKTIQCDDSQFCPNIPQMECDSFTDECQYWYTYGSNGTSLTSGVMGKDIFTLDAGRSLIKTTLVFGCSQQEDEGFNPNAAGFMGLNGGPFSLISQLGVTNSFSYCLTPTNSNFPSKLTLGKQITTQDPTLTITPLIPRFLPKFYVINLLGISIGQMRLNLDRNIYIDTSSTLTYMDPSICSSIEKAVLETVQVSPIIAPQLSQFRLCFDKISRIDNTPRLYNTNMVLYLNENERIILRWENMFVDLGDVFCLAIVPSQEDGDAMILGNVAQVNFEVQFDLDVQVISFTPKNCQYL